MCSFQFNHIATQQKVRVVFVVRVRAGNCFSQKIGHCEKILFFGILVTLSEGKEIMKNMVETLSFGNN